MSDLPERIWFDGLHAWSYDPPNAIGYREFVRADLAPAVGFSREQMEDALRHFIGPFRSIDIEYYMNSLTPAAQPQTDFTLHNLLKEQDKMVASLTAQPRDPAKTQSTIKWVPTLHPDGTTKVEPREFYEESASISKEQWDSIQPARDPKVLVEALERIVEGFFGENERKIAREALAEWNARQPEVVAPVSVVPIPTGWIPVTERLPEVGVDVLCLWNDGSKMMVVDYLEQRSVSDGAGVQFVKNYIHNYSHWQPLPEPPMTKGRGEV